MRALFLVLFFGFLLIPIATLIAISFNSAKRGAWQEFSFHWYQELFQDSALQEALINSLQTATLTGLLSALLGLFVGYQFFHSRSGWSQTLGQTPIVLPDVVLGIALLSFFVQLGLPIGSVSLILAHTAVGTAYVASLVHSQLKAIDLKTVEAARDLGASEWQAFFQILIPQCMGALISGFLVVWTLSFDDFVLAFFTSGVGATTLPLKIYSMLKFGVTPEVNALCTLILATSFVLISIAFWIRRGDLMGGFSK